MLRDIDYRLERWGDWWTSHVDQSAIGYPSASVEGRAMEGTLSSGSPAHSISPEVMMPPVVAETDRAIAMMPEQWKSLVLLKYIKRERLSKKAHYVQLDRVHHWVSGYIARNG